MHLNKHGIVISFKDSNTNIDISSIKIELRFLREL